MYLTNEPHEFLTFGKYNGHHATNIPAWYREWLLGVKWIGSDLHEALFNVSASDEIITELRPTVRPPKVKLTKSQKKAAAKEAFANFTVPQANTQDFAATFHVDRRSHPYEEGDPF